MKTTFKYCARDPEDFSVYGNSALGANRSPWWWDPSRPGLFVPAGLMGRAACLLADLVPVCRV